MRRGCNLTNFIMPRPMINKPKRRPPKRGGRKRGSNLPDGLPRDVEEHGEDLAALEEADGEEINIGDLQGKDIADHQGRRFFLKHPAVGGPVHPDPPSAHLDRVRL